MGLCSALQTMTFKWVCSSSEFCCYTYIYTVAQWFFIAQNPTGQQLVGPLNLVWIVFACAIHTLMLNRWYLNNKSARSLWMHLENLWADCFAKITNRAHVSDMCLCRMTWTAGIVGIVGIGIVVALRAINLWYIVGPSEMVPRCLRKHILLKKSFIKPNH